MSATYDRRILSRNFSVSNVTYITIKGNALDGQVNAHRETHLGQNSDKYLDIGLK